MVFSGKIYDQVKEQLDKYLFGFDKSQFKCSVLDGKLHPHSRSAPFDLIGVSSLCLLCVGAINLNGCNLKPKKINKLMSSLGVPVDLKAGMIGHLELKVSYLQMWGVGSGSDSLAVKAKNMFVLVGPKMSVLSRNESYIDDNCDADYLEAYDESNSYNIHTTGLALRKKRTGLSDLGLNIEPKRKFTSIDSTLSTLVGPTVILT